MNNIHTVIFRLVATCSITGPLSKVRGAYFVWGSEGIIYQFQLHYYS